jgi:hypothetical protein
VIGSFATNARGCGGPMPGWATAPPVVDTILQTAGSSNSHPRVRVSRVKTTGVTATSVMHCGGRAQGEDSASSDGNKGTKLLIHPAWISSFRTSLIPRCLPFTELTPHLGAENVCPEAETTMAVAGWCFSP